jgi:diguanylate cyclase (GGDEF)-like protein
MKFSILDIFKKIKFYLTVTTLLLVFLSLIEFNRSISYERIQQLEAQKVIVNKVYDLGRNDLDFSIINAQGLGTQLKTNITLMNDLTTNDFLGKLLGLNHEYKGQTEKLSNLEDNFNLKADAYYQKKNENIAQRLNEFSVAKAELLNQLNEMIVSNINDEHQKLSFTKWFVYVSLLLTFAGALWYSRKLTLIYDDIKSLFAIGHERTSESILTKEVDAIKMRMIRKPTLSQNQSMIDPVTGIKNYKGMIQSYSEKKGMKDDNFTIVCVFEVDNFKEYEKNLSKEYTQSVLKKISFIISLYEQPTDVIARIEYDQFAVILSRETKKKAFSDCEAMRQSIEETQFNNPQGGTIPFTISGGFTIKQNNKSLENAISDAKELLQTAKEKGKNRIAQISDHAEKF